MGSRQLLTASRNRRQKADHIEIAVGYVSRASLEELDAMVSELVLKMCAYIGMYYIDGMPEGSYHTAVKINRKWMTAGHR